MLPTPILTFVETHHDTCYGHQRLIIWQTASGIRALQRCEVCRTELSTPIVALEDVVDLYELIATACPDAEFVS